MVRLSAIPLGVIVVAMFLGFFVFLHVGCVVGFFLDDCLRTLWRKLRLDGVFELIVSKFPSVLLSLLVPMLVELVFVIRMY